MKTKLKLFPFLICIAALSWAQDPVPNLILSEASMFCVEDSYVEITNIGTTPADLQRVVLSNAQGGEFTNDTTGNCQFLTGAPMLAPGESYTVYNL
ncbi:MAG: hypothetical protein KAR20_29220, partial [Candidatus Heimdallarchaeota archaeon]|nr:hypothetical protein [Candidatus Heimdallarchaeota archaeon]